MADYGPRREIPSLERLSYDRIRRLYQTEPFTGGYPNPAVSYYRILEFMGRSQNLIVYGNENAARFGWMGAVAAGEIRRWVHRLYNMLENDRKEAKKQYDMLLREANEKARIGEEVDLTEIGILEEESERKLLKLSEPTEGTHVDVDTRTGQKMTWKEVSWGYNFNGHNTYALFIPRSSGTKGVIQESPGSPVHKMFCDIGIMRLDHLHFTDVSRKPGADKEGEFTFVRESASINGYQVVPTGDGGWTEWVRGAGRPDYQSRINFRWVSLEEWKNKRPRKDLYVERQLQPYVKPGVYESPSEVLATGYLYSGSPVHGGWEMHNPDVECSVLYDLHLFDFDVNRMPPIFQWITDLAETFAEWKPRSYPENRKYDQFYGMRGPANVPTIYGSNNILNARKAMERLKTWMKVRGIPLTPRQEHFYEKEHNDYSVETAHFSERTGDEVSYYEKDTVTACQIQ
jgi:hypothetical protein